MHLTRIRRLTLALIFSAAAFSQWQPATAVAIFYDGPAQPLAEGYLDARHIENLMGHFGLASEVIPLADY